MSRKSRKIRALQEENKRLRSQLLHKVLITDTSFFDFEKYIVKQVVPPGIEVSEEEIKRNMIRRYEDAICKNMIFERCEPVVPGEKVYKGTLFIAKWKYMKERKDEDS